MKDGGRQILLDDAQVLAACPNHPQHVAIKPSMKAVVKNVAVRISTSIKTHATGAPHGTHHTTTF
jgi:hypothetical protein